MFNRLALINPKIYYKGKITFSRDCRSLNIYYNS